MSEVYDQLNDLYKLHIAAIELEHGVRIEDWRPFEPSHFVYAFFAFNSFYSINWEESARKQKLIKWEIRNSGTGDDVAGKTESQKIREMSKFIYSTYVNDSLPGEESKNAKKEFASRLSECIVKFLKEDVRSALQSLNGIIPDINIDEAMKARFNREFGRLLKKEIVGKNLTDALDTVLNFVSAVRNNIFHGTKTVLDMLGEDQKVRLQAYTSILLAFNEMLFEAIESRSSRFNWDRKQIDNDLKIKHQERVKGIECRFYRNTIASRYGIDIPNGPLFYPCSGDDT